jgi:hypothetical protein
VVCWCVPAGTCHRYRYGSGTGTKKMTCEKTHTRGAGTGFHRYGYGYCQKYLWVTCAEHYTGHISGRTLICTSSVVVCEHIQSINHDEAKSHNVLEERLGAIGPNE